MAHVSIDHVKDTTTTTGTTAFALSAVSPTSWYKLFSDVMSVGDTCYYCAQGQTGTEYEVGFGTYSSANTLTRTTIYKSSNADAIVTFSAGTKDVFITMAAQRTLQLDAAGKIPANDGSLLTSLSADNIGAGTLAAARGGAGAINGVMKANGSGVVSLAAAGTDYMHPGTTSLLTKGFTLTPYSIGTPSNGSTLTPDAANGNYQYLTNNVAGFTIAAPTADCAIDIYVLNGASAGTITFTSFTVGAATGSAYVATNTYKFILSIRKINSIATYIWYAMQ